MITVSSYGGGRNSKWMIAKWVLDGNRLDMALFADTGRWDAEKPETYKDVIQFQSWLSGHGVPLQVVRVSGETLEENCLRRGQLPAIAYGFKTCSLRWKIEPQEKFLNNWSVTKDAWDKREKVLQLVGFHAGEGYRANPFEDAKYIKRYPLIEWGIDNEACADGLRSVGLCVPPKSSCFFCPNMGEVEVLDLNDSHPELIQRALKMEETAAPNLVQIKGLGRELSWKQILEYDKAQIALLPKRDRTVPCSCYDGE